MRSATYLVLYKKEPERKKERIVINNSNYNTLSCTSEAAIEFQSLDDADLVGGIANNHELGSAISVLPIPSEELDFLSYSG